MGNMADITQITIYAELLPNLRQISVAVTLPSPADADGTLVQLTDNGAAIQVKHDGLVKSMRLPAQAEVRGAVSVPLPLGPPHLAPVKEASWRLPLSSSVPPTVPGREAAAAGAHGGESVPWSATALVTGSEVRCRTCNTSVVAAGKLAAWKDLPSENWAEMMEFWHCHKPDHDHHETKRQTGDEPHGHGDKAAQDSLAGRGYGANSTISAQAGVGFVDLMAFSFAEDDCSGLTVR